MHLAVNMQLKMMTKKLWLKLRKSKTWTLEEISKNGYTVVPDKILNLGAATTQELANYFNRLNKKLKEAKTSKEQSLCDKKSKRENFINKNPTESEKGLHKVNKYINPINFPIMNIDPTKDIPKNNIKNNMLKHIVSLSAIVEIIVVSFVKKSYKFSKMSVVESSQTVHPSTKAEEPDGLTNMIEDMKCFRLDSVPGDTLKSESLEQLVDQMNGSGLKIKADYDLYSGLQGSDSSTQLIFAFEIKEIIKETLEEATFNIFGFITWRILVKILWKILPIIVKKVEQKQLKKHALEIRELLVKIIQAHQNGDKKATEKHMQEMLKYLEEKLEKKDNVSSTVLLGPFQGSDSALAKNRVWEAQKKF